ncbi:MAG TPA: CHAT domain-containing protein, partial [Gemmata sp.]
MPTPSTLIVHHVANTDPPQFTVQRLGDGKTAPPAVVAPPNSVRVDGRLNTRLTDELRWYLEEFLSYPFPPQTDHAERVWQAVETWGQQTFTALFADTHARRSYEKAVESGFDHLTIRIVSDSPAVLGWPWEALHDPEPGGGRLAHHCAIERRIDSGRDPVALAALPADRVNVLLVIARPLAGDIRYRSVSRSLVELAVKHTFPIAVDVLRPPTFDQLREHLRQRPRHYHILHFDGHGAYRTDLPSAVGTHAMLRAADARLLFEKEDGTKDPVEASKLSELLREHAVPAVVLNACQSAAIDDTAADPFASVAASLLRAGTRSVVAMAYALYVSGAQQFLPAFYGTLFGSGDLAGAVRAGRQMMLRNPERACARGTFPLADWAVPVVYQQAEPLDFSFVARGKAAPEPTGTKSRLPAEAREDRNPYGFVGRDGAVLELERALRRPPAGVLITGMGGVGKTTLVRGFLNWLEQTNGLGAGALWFDFREIHSAEAVLNRIGEALTGRPEFAALDAGHKLDFLGAYKDVPVRIVWDNFESAHGVAGTSRAGNLSEDDQRLLKELLTRLRGGRTKVLITSRSDEEWLGVTNIGKPVGLAGLDGEERWEFANTVVCDLGLTLDRKAPAVSELMTLLRGHPLAMRVVLSKLARRSAAELTNALGANFAQLVPRATDEAEALVFATLQFATEALPAPWQPLLIPLALHEG